MKAVIISNIFIYLIIKNEYESFSIPLNCILGIATFSQIAEKTDGSSKRSRYCGLITVVDKNCRAFITS